jgi:hypothetical protein
MLFIELFLRNLIKNVNMMYLVLIGEFVIIKLHELPSKFFID